MPGWLAFDHLVPAALFYARPATKVQYRLKPSLALLPPDSETGERQSSIQLADRHQLHAHEMPATLERHMRDRDKNTGKRHVCGIKNPPDLYLLAGMLAGVLACGLAGVLACVLVGKFMPLGLLKVTARFTGQPSFYQPLSGSDNSSGLSGESGVAASGVSAIDWSSIWSPTRPAFCLIADSISLAISGCSRRNVLAFSRP